MYYYKYKDIFTNCLTFRLDRSIHLSIYKDWYSNCFLKIDFFKKNLFAGDNPKIFYDIN